MGVKIHLSPIHALEFKVVSHHKSLSYTLCVTDVSIMRKNISTGTQTPSSFLGPKIETLATSAQQGGCGDCGMNVVVSAENAKKLKRRGAEGMADSPFEGPRRYRCSSEESTESVREGFVKIL